MAKPAKDEFKLPDPVLPKAPQKANPAPEPPAQDHRPPKIGAKEIMASFEHLGGILRARKLKELARKHPEIAKLLQAQEAVKSEAPVVVPLMETVETKKPVEAV